MKINHIKASPPYETNTFLLTGDGSGCIIIDPAADIELYRELCEGDITMILTHGHHDHVGTVDALRALGAKLNMSREDAEHFSLSPDGFLSEGDTVSVGGIELSVLATPGHTPGGLCFYHKDGHLFAGDTLFYRTCGRCDLPGGDLSVMRKSLKRLSTLPAETIVYPGHDRFTTIGEEVAQNPYM